MTRRELAGTSAMLLLFSVPALAGETLTSIDITQVEVRRGESRWQLWSGTRLIKDLGTSEAEAREVISVIRTLRLTQVGTIGTRGPVMEYWLADGKAPQGMVPAYRLFPLDGATLRVEQIEGQWCLRDGRQLWFNFGVHEQDAKRALEVIQRHEFNRIGYVGQVEPVMIYFLCVREEKGTPAKMQSSVVFSQLEAFHARQLTPPSLTSLDAATGEEKLPFDWRRVELRRDGQRNKLMAGRECLAEFSDSVAAREALHAIQFYRFTEQCRLGDTATPLLYYLVNGQAPRGLRFGSRNTSFHPERLTVRQVDKQWMICDGARPILRGGDSEEDAKRSLKAIQKYKFDNLCVIGDAEQGGLKFLVKER